MTMTPEEERTQARLETRIFNLQQGLAEARTSRAMWQEDYEHMVKVRDQWKARSARFDHESRVYQGVWQMLQGDMVDQIREGHPYVQTDLLKIWLSRCKEYLVSNLEGNPE